MESKTFLAFAECFTEAMMMVTGHGRIIATNSAGLALLGQSKLADLEGQALSQFVVDEDGKLDKYLVACTDSDSPLTGVLQLQTADGTRQILCQGRGVKREYSPGSETNIILRCLPQTHAEVDTQAINASLLQLTNEIERRRLAEQRLSLSEAQAQAVLDTAVDGIVTINSAGVIESFNKAAEYIFGYQASEVLGRSVECLMPPPYRDEHQTYIQRYLTTGEKKNHRPRPP